MNETIFNASGSKQVDKTGAGNTDNAKYEAEELCLESLPIQLKLSVGAANDPLEHEADAMADRVMRMPEPSCIQRKGQVPNYDEDDEHVRLKPVYNRIPLIQRKSPTWNNEYDDERVQLKPLSTQITPFIQKKGSEGGAASDAVSSKIQSTRGGGSTIGSGTLSFMESRFGSDFDNVKIHNDSESADLSDSLNAKAFTVGSDIYFNRGEYQPESHTGKTLLAHELTHVIQQKATPIAVQRQPKATAPVPPAGGNILYIGMNNFKPELNKLKELYKGKPVIITSVTVSTEEKATKVSTGTFDLTTASGVHDFAASISKDTTTVGAIEKLINACLDSEKDDLAHVISVYADCENNNKQLMDRVVLSGHSVGYKIYNHDEIKDVSNGEIRFDDLVTLGKLFPKAAAQTKHLVVMACFAGTEDNIKKYFVAAYPNLMTASAWVGMSPTDAPAANELAKWAQTTDSSPTKLAMPGKDKANWALGVYQTDSPPDPVALMSDLRSLEPKFNEYFDGTKVDADSHSGLLVDYYSKARTAEQMISQITGADHDYAKLHADQSFRLRFWQSMVAQFWKKNADIINKAYGGTAPVYSSMKRKEALAAIAKFDAEAKGDKTDIDKARPLLIGLKNLDPTVLSDTWVH